MTDVTRERLEAIIDATVIERDHAAVQTRSEIAGAVAPFLSDVTDAAPGERFATVLEEVLMARLRSMRDALRAGGVEC